ncbi:MAG: 6-phosphogluconolactonase [Thermosynechococcaceae cyanobacterium]
MESSVEIVSDASALADRALTIVRSMLETAIAQQGVATIALAGGSTPKLLYERLATQSLPWDKLHIFWGDERYVPPSHPDSNEGMARRAWLDRVPIPADCLHPMPTHPTEPIQAAHLYEQELQNFFGTEVIPAFDIILLGLGDDGHTASLFPRTEVLNVCDRWIGVGSRGTDPRLTFTIPLINRARCVLFLVTGVGKHQALRAIFDDTANPLDYPARFIQPEGQLIWLLDQAAGDGLVQ